MAAWPWVTALVLLGGCMAGAEPEGSPADGPADGLMATAETGLLRGVVVDEAIRPMSGVAVTASRADEPVAEAITNDQGQFGFDRLRPGSYVLEATKAGYFGQVVVAAVHVNVPDPPVVQMQLTQDAESLPYVVAVAFEGFIECSVRGGTGGVAVCGAVQNYVNLTSERSLLKMPIDPGPSWLQAEMVWETTQPLADTMGFYFHQFRDGGDTAYMGIYPLNLGTSPLLLTVDSEGLGRCQTCTEDALNMTGWESLWVKAMAGDLSASRPPEVCSPTGQPCLAGTGVVLQQRFQFYVHIFHRTVPPEGWRFTSDGPPSV